MRSPKLAYPLKWHHVTCDEQVTLSRMLKRLTSGTSETGFHRACFLFVLLVSLGLHVQVSYIVVLTFKLHAAFKNKILVVVSHRHRHTCINVVLRG